MINNDNFDDFLRSLKTTNATLSYFADLEKCLVNVSAISVKLHALNYLLGKQDLKREIAFLYKENPKCFSALKLLIAVRDNKVHFNEFGELVDINSYFKNPNDIFRFFENSGLLEIFSNKKITNLNDYVFGVEVGLDSNARKNRGGRNMEILIANIFKNNQIKFKEQLSIKALKSIDLGYDEKKFDFVIFSKEYTYLIECNFYSTGGSKLNETARSYIEVSNKINQFKNYRFIWITDGVGWLSAKNKLQEAYKTVEIYNLTNLNRFIKKVKNETFHQ